MIFYQSLNASQGSSGDRGALGLLFERLERCDDVDHRSALRIPCSEGRRGLTPRRVLSPKGRCRITRRGRWPAWRIAGGVRTLRDIASCLG